MSDKVKRSGWRDLWSYLVGAAIGIGTVTVMLTGQGFPLPYLIGFTVGLAIGWHEWGRHLRRIEDRWAEQAVRIDAILRRDEQAKRGEQ